MISLPPNFIDNLIANAGGVMTDLMPFALLLFGVPLGIWIVEGIIDWATRAEERKIGRAISGTLGNKEELTAEEWKEVYRQKGRGYKEWIGGTKMTESEFLEYNKRL
jgi:hypothetical protein